MSSLEGIHVNVSVNCIYLFIYFFANHQKKKKMRCIMQYQTKLYTYALQCVSQLFHNRGHCPLPTLPDSPGINSVHSRFY